jgi:hypothetical protein
MLGAITMQSEIFCVGPDLALDEDGRSALRPDRFIFGEIAPDTDWVEDPRIWLRDILVWVPLT